MSKLLDKLIKQEADFFKSEFIAPVCSNKTSVRLAGVIFSFKVLPSDFCGWGIFQAVSAKYAEYKREPTIEEKDTYLSACPGVFFIICDQERELGLCTKKNSSRFKITGLVPIRLLKEAQLFDIVYTRFDGYNFWYDKPSVYFLEVSEFLKNSLNNEIVPKDLKYPGLTPEARAAYNIVYEKQKARKEEEYRASTGGRITIHLERAGAKLRSYVERDNTYTVEFIVDGQNHRSVIDKNLQVQSAGICLTDHHTGVAHDSDFDLQSLVTVIREGQSTGRIYRA
jgi:hypothetical protein